MMADMQNTPEMQQISVDDLSKKIKETADELNQLKNGLNNFSLEQQNNKLADIENAILECATDLATLEKDGYTSIDKMQLDTLKSQIDTLVSSKETLKKQIEKQTQEALSNLNQSVTQQEEQQEGGEQQDGKEKKGLRKWRDGLSDGKKKGVRVGGGILAGVGIFSLFRRRRKKKKESSPESIGSKKSFWERPIGKVVKWTGIGTGVYYVSRGLTTGDWSIFGRNPFSKEKKDGPATSPGSNIERSEKAYDNLPEEDKKIYESSAIAINEYQGNIMGDQGGSGLVEDLMGDSEFDNDKIGLVPFILSNRYDSLNKMLSETSLYYEIAGIEGRIARDKLKDWGLDGVKKLLTPLVGIVNGLTFDLLNIDDGRDKLIERLKGIDGLEQILRTVFRKSITVMSYYQSRKGALEIKLAEQELLKSDSNFANLSEEDKLDEITDHLQNDERYKQHIEPEVSNFMKMNIKNATVYLQEKWLLNGELDASMKLSINKIEKNRKDLLRVEDDDDTSILEDMKSELSNGKLSEKAQKKLKNLCEDFEEEMFTMGKQSRYAKYLPMFQIFDGGEKLINDIQNCGDYENIANKYKEQVDNILKKSENGTMQESDLDLLEETINDYYKFQKSLFSSEINLEKSVDERGNIVFRWGRSFLAGGQNIRSGIQIVTGLKDGSNREGAGLIAGGIISVDALTFGLAGKKLVGFSPFWTLNKKVVFPVAKGGLKLTGKGMARLTGNVMRANCGGLVPARFYTEDTLRIAIARGDVSLNRAVKIARKNGFKVANVPNAPTINNNVDLVKRMFNFGDGEARRVVNIVDKFGDNPNIYKQIMKGKYDWNKSTSRRKPADRFHLNRSKQLFEIDPNALERFEHIAKRIDDMKGTEKTVMLSMMKSVKTVDQAEDLAIMGVGDDVAKLLESGNFMKAEEYGKYLAKYASKVDPNDMRAFEKFIREANEAKKIGSNSKLFVRNSMKNFSKIKDNGFAIDKIDDLALNSSKWSKLAESTKANCNKVITRLNEMVKNPKFKPFHKNIGKQIEGVREIERLTTPESVKAMKNMSIFGRETAFAKLSAEGTHQLSRLSYMLRDVDMAKDLTKALRTANTLDDVKDILRGQGIVVEHIDDAVLLKIAKSRNAQHIKDIVNYGAEFEAIQGIGKVLKTPAFKMAGKVLGRALIVADFALVGYNFYSEYNEAQEVKKYNLERGEWKESQSYFELAMGGIGAVAGVCMCIPGYGWIAGGVLFASMAVMEVGNKYFEDIEKFKQNQADFLAKGIAATKQELTTVDSREQGISRTWIDKLSVLDSNWTWILDPVTFGLGKAGASSVEKKAEGASKTKASALQALIRMEEIQKNPLAGADLNDPEVLKDPELVEAIRVAKQQVEEIVQKRFAYFQANYLDKNKPLIDKTNFDGDSAISAIEHSLEMSSLAMAMNSDNEYKGEKDPEKYRETKLQELREGNEGNFSKLEKLYKENPISLFQMYAELPYYKSMLIQYGDNDSTKLMDACDYFEKYMSYKILGKPITALPVINIDPENIDYNPIHNFLSHFALIPTLFEKNEAMSFEGKLSDQDILDKYGVSGNLGQDILFECAKILDYDGKNSLEELKRFFNEGQKDVNGIYFDQKNHTWYVNEDRARDDDFATDSQLNSLTNIENMRRYINANVNKSGSGKMFTESSNVNREVGNKILGVINNYISLRKGQTGIKNGIDDYIRKHATNNNYIYLPSDLIVKARKAGLEGVGAHLYGLEGGKISKI